MIQYTWFYKLCVVVICVIAFRIVPPKHDSKKSKFVALIMLGYIVVLIGYVFFPIRYDAELYSAVEDRTFVNFIPLHTILTICKNASRLVAFLQIAGNVVLFIPFG